jgi:hypothetical protein
MNCPNCTAKVASFKEWYGGKCFKTTCPSCKVSLEADSKTILSLVIIIFIALGGAAIIFINYSHLDSGKYGPSHLFVLIFNFLCIYPLGFIVYKFIGGYWVKKNR